MSAAANRSVRPENVEFTVKAAEDLILSGTERSIVRVAANNMYSCLMQKTQRFSSLFRHYSKHHGLPRESLDFFFTSRLDPEDSPESVHLQKNDIILVRRRVTPSLVTVPVITHDSFFNDMRQLLERGEGADVTFRVGPAKQELRAHRVVLTARCEIFAAMFRRGAMCESENGIVCIPDHAVEMVAKMLEFIYTNAVSDLSKLTAPQLIDLIALSDQYLLQPLKQLCEIAARDVLSTTNVGQFLSAARNYNAPYLKDYCLNFFTAHMSDVVDDESFREELERCPSLALTLLKASTRPVSDDMTQPLCKRRRLTMPHEDPDL